MTPSAAFVALSTSESEHPFKYRENEVIKEQGILELHIELCLSPAMRETLSPLFPYSTENMGLREIWGRMLEMAYKLLPFFYLIVL